MNLAIKGHSTRGSEVIALLEMLGGENERFQLDGLNEEFIYYFCPEYSNDILSAIIPIGQIVFTLEEFEEKFPYKVGDMARLSRSNIAVIIKAIKWENDEIIYRLSCDDSRWWSVNNLKPYREKTMESNKCTYCVYAVNNNHCGLRGFRSNFNVNYCSAQNIDKLPNGFELQEDGYFSWVNEKPKYPTTYDECCKVLGYESNRQSVTGYDAELIENFQKLLICRDAYWNTAGEQIGLDKPWEPDWLNVEQEKYVLFTHNNTIDSNFYVLGNNILAFPTAEMRNAFYENFKELIEACKELL